MQSNRSTTKVNKFNKFSNQSKISNTEKQIALTQVFLLFLSIIAIAFILGSSIPSVSAATPPRTYTLRSSELPGTTGNVKVNLNDLTQVQTQINRLTKELGEVKPWSVKQSYIYDDLGVLDNANNALVKNQSPNKDENLKAPTKTKKTTKTKPPIVGSSASLIATKSIKTLKENVEKQDSNFDSNEFNNIKAPVVPPKPGLMKTTGNQLMQLGESIVMQKAGKLLSPATKAAASTASKVTVAGGSGGFSNLLSSIFSQGSIINGGTMAFGNIMMSLGVYAAIAAAADLVANQLARALGASPDQASSIGNSVGVGVFSGLTLWGIVGMSAGASAGIGAGVAAIYFLFAYKREAGEVVKYQCLPYTAPSGANNCAACNTGVFPCTEYQCKSLGQNCKLFGSKDGKQLCVAVDRNQVNPPQISAWEKPLKDGFSYTPLKTNFPEDRGVKVVNKNDAKGCVKPFQSVSFGIKLDQPGICKFDFNRTPSYDSMQNQFFNNGQPVTNSSLSFTFPDAASMNASGFSYNSLFNKVYVRCKNAAGNKDKANFVFNFCVDPAPDMAPPVILEASPLENSPIAYNTSTVNATFYVNKPSSCKWANQNLAYKDMKNNMTCAQTIEQGVTTKNTIAYPCTANLNSIVNYKTNNFYVRCKSYPGRNESKRTEMTNAYKYSLISTRPLQISKVTPNQTTIKSSSAVIPVTITVNTLGGENNGVAYCSYNLNNSGKVLMFNTGKAQSTQELNLDPGTYSLEINCADRAANIQTVNTTFTVYSDTLPPFITRVYSQEDNLNIITDENSTCVYSKDSCNYQFEDGVAMQDTSQTQHYIPWDTNSTLYVKCEDSYGNQPDTGTCSIVVQPYSQK